MSTRTIAHERAVLERIARLAGLEGMTQEGVAESLATRKPDTSHTIAEHED